MYCIFETIRNSVLIYDDRIDCRVSPGLRVENTETSSWLEDPHEAEFSASAVILGTWNELTSVGIIRILCLGTECSRTDLNV